MIADTVRAMVCIMVTVGLVACSGGSGGSSDSTNTTSGTNSGAWTAGAKMPTARYWAASVAVGNDIYVIGGRGSTIYDESGVSKVEKYNTITDSWTSLPDMPIEDYDLRGANVNGQIYIFGGRLHGNTLVYRYDPTSGNWTKLNTMPALPDMGAPAVVNDKVYIFGNSTTNTPFEYDTSTDTWTIRAAMPTARYAPATAIYDGKIYVLGGFSGSENKNEVYDPATDSWQIKASLPSAHVYSTTDRPIAGVLNGQVYFFSHYSGIMAVYAASTDSWSSISGFVNSPESYSTGEAVNGKLYVIGGDNCTDTNYCAVEIYTP